MRLLKQMTDLSTAQNNKFSLIITKTLKCHFQEVFIYLKKQISCSKYLKKKCMITETTQSNFPGIYRYKLVLGSF